MANDRYTLRDPGYDSLVTGFNEGIKGFMSGYKDSKIKKQFKTSIDMGEDPETAFQKIANYNPELAQTLYISEIKKQQKAQMKPMFEQINEKLGLEPGTINSLETLQAYGHAMDTEYKQMQAEYTRWQKEEKEKESALLAQRRGDAAALYARETQNPVTAPGDMGAAYGMPSPQRQDWYTGPAEEALRQQSLGRESATLDKLVAEGRRSVEGEAIAGEVGDVISGTTTVTLGSIKAGKVPKEVAAFVDLQTAAGLKPDTPIIVNRSKATGQIVSIVGVSPTALVAQQGVGIKAFEAGLKERGQDRADSKWDVTQYGILEKYIDHELKWDVMSGFENGETVRSTYQWLAGFLPSPAGELPQVHGRRVLDFAKNLRVKWDEGMQKANDFGKDTPAYKQEVAKVPIHVMEWLQSHNMPPKYAKEVMKRFNPLFTVAEGKDLSLWDRFFKAASTPGVTTAIDTQYDIPNDQLGDPLG